MLLIRKKFLTDMIAHALEGLLVRSLEAFRAELAEIILFGSEENPSLRTLLGPGSYRELMEPVDSDVADEMRFRALG